MTHDPHHPPPQDSQPGADDAPWSLWKLGLLLYPFVFLVVWINLFMLALIGTFVGLRSLTTAESLLVSILVALPACWLSARWVRRLLDRAAED